MPTESSEKIKLYLVIVLALIAAVVAYFRFVHKGGGTAAKIAPAPPPKAQQLDLASVKTPDNSLRPRALRRPAAELLDKDIRDIFAPPKLPKKPEPPAPRKPSAQSKPAGKAPVLAPPAPSPHNVELRGTVVGGNEPLAIINDKFVRIGEKVGDYEVVEITAKTVRLRAGKYQKVLQVLNLSQK